MAYNWDGLMELFEGKYRPTWTSLCGGADVKGIMELSGGKYRPKADAHGVCDALPGIMVKNGGKYFPRIVLNDQYSCCPAFDCDHCKPALWANGETPKIVKAVVSDIIECGECSEGDPNGTYTLTQHSEEFPCWWYGTSGIFTVRWGAFFASGGDNYSALHVYSEDYIYFADSTTVTCRTSFANSFVEANCCVGPGAWGLPGDPLFIIAGYGGTAEISWPV